MKLKQGHLITLHDPTVCNPYNVSLAEFEKHQQQQKTPKKNKNSLEDCCEFID